MTRFSDLKERIIRRFEIEFLSTAIILASLLYFRNSKEIVLGISIIYLVCMTVIYGFRKGT